MQVNFSSAVPIIIHFKSCKQAVNNLLFDFCISFLFQALAGNIVLFLGETFYSHSASVSPQVYKWVLAKLMFGDNPSL